MVPFCNDKSNVLRLSKKELNWIEYYKSCEWQAFNHQVFGHQLKMSQKIIALVQYDVELWYLWYNIKTGTWENIENSPLIPTGDSQRCLASEFISHWRGIKKKKEDINISISKTLDQEYSTKQTRCRTLYLKKWASKKTFVIYTSCQEPFF